MLKQLISWYQEVVLVFTLCQWKVQGH